MQQVPQSQSLTAFKTKNASSPKIYPTLEYQTQNIQNAQSHQNLQYQQQQLNLQIPVTKEPTAVQSLQYMHSQIPNSNQYLSVNPSYQSLEKSSQSNTNVYGGILGHRNSNVSVAAGSGTQSSHQHNSSSLNTSNLQRKLKQSPNIVRDNKLFPNDFFLNQNQFPNANHGSPFSKNSLHFSSKNYEGTQHQKLHESIFNESEEELDEKLNYQAVQQLPLAKTNVKKISNENRQNLKDSKRFKFSEDIENSEKERNRSNLNIVSSKNKKKNSKMTAIKQSQLNQEAEVHQSLSESFYQNQIFQKENQENQNQLNNLQDLSEKQFNGLKTQLLNLSLDSDKIKKYGLNVAVKNAVANSNFSEKRKKGKAEVLSGSQHNHQKKTLKKPFESIDQQISYKNQNYLPSPKHKHGQLNISRDFSRNNEVQSYHSLHTSMSQNSRTQEAQMRSTLNRFSQNKEVIFPELQSSINRNQQQQKEFYQDYNFQQNQIHHEPIQNDYSQKRQINSTKRMPISMKQGQYREDADQYTQQSYFQDRNIKSNTSQTVTNSRDFNQDESSRLHIQNADQGRYRNSIQNKNESEQNNMMNGGSPQSSNMNDISSSQVHSNGKQSVNSSTLMQINQNHHHYWNRSPQILRDLDSQQNLQNQPLYFPQSTRNTHLSRSPPHGFNAQFNEKAVKFPNIFNHNTNHSQQINQSQLTNSFNQQSHSQNSHFNVHKKGKIAIDHNYQVIKNVPSMLERHSIGSNSRNQNTIQERKETSESERSFQQEEYKLIEKGKINRKMLTSRDQDERWIKDQSIDRRSLGRIQSISNLDRKKSNPDQFECHKGSIRKQSNKKIKKSNQFSQSGACWYNSPQHNKSNGVTTFGQSPDLSHSKNYQSKEKAKNNQRIQDQPRFSLPENNARLIHEELLENNQFSNRVQSRYDTQRNDLNQIQNDQRSGIMKYEELETPNFKSSFGLQNRNSIVQTHREQSIDKILIQKYHRPQNLVQKNEKSPKNNISSNSQNQNTQSQEVLPFDFVPNQREFFENQMSLYNSKLTPNQQSISNFEYARLQVNFGLEDMREGAIPRLSMNRDQSTHAHYDNSFQKIDTAGNQLVQPVQVDGNVELTHSLNQSPQGYLEGEVKKFRVISKSKRKEKEKNTILNQIQGLRNQEDKSKLIQNLERNVKNQKILDMNQNFDQNEQQEQTQAVQKASRDNLSQKSTLQIKEGNSSNTPSSQNNSHLQKKIPLIKKSQIQSINKNTEQAAKANIVRAIGGKGLINSNSHQGQNMTEVGDFTHVNSDSKQTKTSLINNQQLLQSLNFDQFNINNQQNHQQEQQVQNLNNQTNQYSTIKDQNFHRSQIQKTGEKRLPLQELENKNTRKHQKLNDQFGQTSSNTQTCYFETKLSSDYDKTPSFNTKNPSITQHFNQIYMAAQIPQEFNGMITFMNIQHQISSDLKSQPQDYNKHQEIEAFKSTGGSLMRGTILSLTHSSTNNGNGSAQATFNQNFINGQTGNNPSQGSCNNSIVMVQSQNNYLTSDFGGGQIITNPLSTQHLFILQQQMNDNKNRQQNINNFQSEVSFPISQNTKESKFQQDQSNLNQKTSYKLVPHQNQQNQQRNQFIREHQVNNNKENQLKDSNKINQRGNSEDKFKIEFQNSKVKKPENSKMQFQLTRKKEADNNQQQVAIQKIKKLNLIKH